MKLLSEDYTDIKQNYGGNWIRALKLALKYNCTGISRQELMLIFDALNILPNKAKELIAQYNEIGRLQVINGLWHYVDNPLDIELRIPTVIKKESTEDIIRRERRKEKPELEEQPKEPHLETIAELRARRNIEYQEYKKRTEHLNREPKIYEDWLTEKNRIENFNEQKKDTG